MKALFVAALVRFLFRRLNYVLDDPDDVYWAWEKLFVEALDDHAPVKSFRRRHRDQFQFVNPELREVMRERNRCKKQFNKSRKPQLKTGKSTRRQLRNRAVSMKRKRVRNHFSRICKVKHSDQRKIDPWA